MATDYCRGHLIVWDQLADVWRYADTGEPAEDWGGAARPCPQCSQLPHPDGRDACLSVIPGAVAACCGHGVKRGYIAWPNEDASSD